MSVEKFRENYRDAMTRLWKLEGGKHQVAEAVAEFDQMLADNSAKVLALHPDSAFIGKNAWFQPMIGCPTCGQLGVCETRAVILGLLR